MANSKQAKPGGLTSGKAIVIAVLALVLVGVVYWQFGASQATAAYAKPGGSHRRPAAASHREACCYDYSCEKEPSRECTAGRNAGGR